MAEKDPIARIKELDAEKSKLIESAKSEALERAKQAVADLNALGFAYSLAQASVAKKAVGRKAVGTYRVKARAGFAAFRPDRRTMPASTGSPRPRSGHSTRRNSPTWD
jgi:hypothetical protein